MFGRVVCDKNYFHYRSHSCVHVFISISPYIFHLSSSPASYYAVAFCPSSIHQLIICLSPSCPSNIHPLLKKNMQLFIICAFANGHLSPQSHLSIMHLSPLHQSRNFAINLSSLHNWLYSSINSCPLKAFSLATVSDSTDEFFPCFINHPFIHSFAYISINQSLHYVLNTAVMCPSDHQ